MLHWRRLKVTDRCFCATLLAITIISCYIFLAFHNDDYVDELKRLQRTLHFVKPASTWNYNNTWKFIGNASRRHEIYSAYFDSRIDVMESISTDKSQIPIGSVRIFAILPTYFRDTISCVLRFEDFTLREVQAAEARAMQEHHEERFAAYTIMCPFHIKPGEQTIRLPQSVAIAYASNRLSHISPTFVYISYPRNMDDMFAKSKPTISVCVAPFQFHYANVLRIVEFVEMYRILGASHFYFYNFESSDNVKRLILHYHSMGLANLIDWNIEAHTEDIHYAGIVAQYNDCIYRAMIVDNHRYAAVLDIDEILVPFKHNSLAEYLRQCDEGRTSAYIFRNVFYYKKDSNDTFSVPQHTRNRMLYTQLKVRRTVEIMPPYTRSKYVANVRAVIEAGNHQLWRNMPGFSDSIVHTTVGLLFHYRDKCINCRTLMIVDYTARRFGSLIWDRVDDICLQVFTERNGYCPME